MFVHKNRTLSEILKCNLFPVNSIFHSVILSIMGEKEKGEVKKEESVDPVARRVHEHTGPVDDWAERPMNDSHRDKLQEIDGGWMVRKDTIEYVLDD